MQTCSINDYTIIVYLVRIYTAANQQISNNNKTKKKLENKIKAAWLLEQHKIMIKNLYKLNFIKKILWQQVFQFGNK